MGQEEEAKLLKQAAEGDHAAFAALLHDVRPRVARYITRNCPAKLERLYECDDVLQDILLEAFRRIGQFEPRGDDSLYRWLLTIARNRLLALLRTHNADKRAGDARRVDLVDERTVEKLLEDLAVYRRTPSQSAARHEAMAALENSISRLPEDYQKALRLRFFEGKSHKELGELMARNENAAKQLCYRAVLALREEIGSASGFM